MSDFDSAPTELLPDEPPKSGEWVDACDVIAEPTEEEVAEGNAMGESIDPDDDEDGGAVRMMSASGYEVALSKARLLKRIMLEHGVPEVSIELLPGRPSNYGEWDALFTVADMGHHTVSRYSSRSLTPVLALVKRGRSDLPGPLCNGYGGYDLTYRIITFGYANHPGRGGPYTVPALTAGRFTIPQNSARRYTWGTEWEGGLDESDWDRVLRNPRNGKQMTMRQFMGRAHAALEKFLEIHEGAHLEHSTWTSRKIDRLGYTREEGIAEKMPYRNPSNPAPMPTISLGAARDQFRRYLGLEGSKKPTYSSSVKRCQYALNKRYGYRLKIDGIVGRATSGAWNRHELTIGVRGRARVPDAATLANLVRGIYKVIP